jgi:allantoate deiminase
MASDATLRVMQRIEVLSACSEARDILVRRSYTPALREAQTLVGGWMRDAGMQVREDAAGNLFGTYAGSDPAAGTFLLGSHLDSVRDAGRFDGPLGVLVAIGVVERLSRAGMRLPFAVEVVAFADEEGLRFQQSYLGSAALAGRFDPAWLQALDDAGISLVDAMRAFGGDPDAVQSCRRSPGSLCGYCEVHIEQGPVLEAEGLPVGVVSAIAGQDRVSVTLQGTAGHAGTVPMALRHDALCAAAEVVLAVEQTARETPGAVATVGQIAAQPGASNVISGQVRLSVDLRHQDDRVRHLLHETLRERVDVIAAGRGVDLAWQVIQSSAAVPCSPRLMEALGLAIAASGYPVRQLPSGAGHDGVMVSSLTEIAMLFVRCKGGISHNPAESVLVEDVDVALTVMERFVKGLEAL